MSPLSALVLLGDDNETLNRKMKYAEFKLSMSKMGRPLNDYVPISLFLKIILAFKLDVFLDRSLRSNS